MTYCFDDNEFSKWDLLEYVSRAYGTQISGEPFSIHNVNVWIRVKKLPDAYGGNRILDVIRYNQLDGLTMIHIDQLSRSDIEAVYGKLSEFTRALNHSRAVTPRLKGKGKRKQRTELYHQILKDRKSLQKPAIPNNYKELGIKENQFKNKK